MKKLEVYLQLKKFREINFNSILLQMWRFHEYFAEKSCGKYSLSLKKFLAEMETLIRVASFVISQMFPIVRANNVCAFFRQTYKLTDYQIIGH